MIDNNASPNVFKADQIESGNNITSVEVDLTPVANSRISQQYVRPNAVKDTALGPVIKTSANGIGNGLAATANITSGNTQIFNFILRDKTGKPLLAVPDISVYIDSITPDNQWPKNGFSMASFPVSVMNDWGMTNNLNVVTRALIRNVTANTVFTIVVCRWRIITNANVELTQAGNVGTGNLLTSASGLFGVGSAGLH